jgi:hypothetical protein
MRTVLLKDEAEAKTFLERFIFTTSEDDPTKLAGFDDLCIEDLCGVLEIPLPDMDDEGYETFGWDDMKAAAYAGDCKLLKSKFPCVVTWWLGSDWDRAGDMDYRLFHVNALEDIALDTVTAEHQAEVDQRNEEIRLYREYTKNGVRACA